MEGDKRIDMFFKKSPKVEKPSESRQKQNYIGHSTNPIMLIILVSAILILVGSTLYFQFFLGGVSTEKGSLESRLKQVERDLTTTVLQLNTTKNQLDVSTRDVSQISGLYNSTTKDLENANSELEDKTEELSNIKSELSTVKVNFITTEEQLNKTKSDLSSSKADLETTKSKLNSVCAQLSDNGLSNSNCP